jgi:lipoprotein-releasing system ATP-binding protein
MSDIVLELKGIERVYRQAEEHLDVLKGVGLVIHKGEMVALVGPSGAGKSTLLHVAGLLEFPDAGDVLLEGVSCAELSDDARTDLRRTKIGFIYQFHHLLSEFSALENVMIPQMIEGMGRRQAKASASVLIESVGLTTRATHRPAKLSGGEQQRVAIARALANSPAILLADEPTGNLDTHTADSVFGLLETLVSQSGLGALVATHNFDLANRMDRILRLENGKLHEGPVDA